MFYDLSDKWVGALDRYQDLMELFGENEEQVAMLNAVSGRFFGDIQEIQSNDLILRLTRLTDKNRPTVSVHRLPRLLRRHPQLPKQVELHAAQATAHEKAARDRSNRCIAHVDRSPDPAARVTYREVKKGLDSVYEAPNTVEMALRQSHLCNEVITEMRTAKFVGRLECLTKAAPFIESKETSTADVETAKAFVTKIGGRGREPVTHLEPQEDCVMHHGDAEQTLNCTKETPTTVSTGYANDLLPTGLDRVAV